MSSRITPEAYEQAGTTLHLQFQPGTQSLDPIDQEVTLTIDQTVFIVSIYIRAAITALRIITSPPSLKLRATRICRRTFWLRQNVANGGGARRIRTDDILLAKQALYQLSYGPVARRNRSILASSLASQQRVVGLDRLELSTLRLSGVRSNHLSYRPSRSSVPPTAYRCWAYDA